MLSLSPRVVTQITDASITDIQAGRTGPHIIYTLLDSPKAPWTLTLNDSSNPWTQVLDYSCIWAKEGINEQSIVVSITLNAYNRFGKNYDGTQSHSPGTTCNLTAMLAGDKVDCRDMSAVVQLFSRILGIATSQVRRINGPFDYKAIDPIGSPTWGAGGWNFHQVGWYSSSVYDACLRLNQSNPRVPTGEDINGSYKNDLYDSGDWSPQTPTEFTTIQ